MTTRKRVAVNERWAIVFAMATGCGGVTTTESTSGNADAASKSADASRSEADASGAKDAETFPLDASHASDADIAGAPTIGDDGYLNLSTGGYDLAGYISSFVGGSSSSIALTYGSSSFCASGTVGVNSTYQSYAGAGFNVDQTQSPTGGSVSSLFLSGHSMTVSLTNSANSPLEIELIDSSETYWCYELAQSTSPVTIPLASFNTQCWDNSGASFVPGTAVTAIQLVVPGSASIATPYDFCFSGLTIQ